MVKAGTSVAEPMATWGAYDAEMQMSEHPTQVQAAQHELDPQKMGALLTRLKEEEELELPADMHRFTHTFRDPDLERNYRKFYARSSTIKMRRSLLASFVTLAIGAIRNHAVNPDQLSLVLSIDGALVSIALPLFALYRWPQFCQWLDLDAVMCVALLPVSTLTALALWFDLREVKASCDGDHECLEDIAFRYGILVALAFSALGLLLTTAIRKFVFLLLLQASLVVVFVVLFLVMEGQGTRYLPYVLLLLVSAVLLAMSRSHDAFLRRTYLWHVDTVRLTTVHLRKLDEAKNRKEKVVGYLFHEVRNPINDIVLATSLALDSTPPPAQRQQGRDEPNEPDGFSTPELLRVISDSASAASRVLDDALDLQKLEAGNFAFVHNPFRLGEAYAPVIHATRSRFAAKGVGLELDDHGLADIGVIGDLKRLRQVVHNFLSNALKFSSLGGRVRVEVTREGISAAQCTVRLAVSDEGIGIHPKDRSKIFTPYSQIRAAETQGGGGTGLGLALSKDFVERGHDGTIGFKSPGTLGRGTTFFFVIAFPMSQQQDLPSSPTPRGGFVVAPQRNVGGKQNNHNHNDDEQRTYCEQEAEAADVLLVDDSAITRKLVGRVLTGLGVRFEDCSNGEEAVQLAKQKSFRLILMDKEMPVMDGFEATKLIRGFNPTIPIVGVTGNAMDNQRQDFVNCGATEVVSKPIGKEGLVAVLSRYHVLSSPPG